ncbi:MAG: hypothetical protein AAFP28_07295 [Pseudomonadota bacterium]
MTEGFTLDGLKREAKLLQKAHKAGDHQAELHMRQWLGDKRDLKLADFLHAVARERGFQSWPKLKIAVEADGLDLAEARERLGRSLYFGSQIWVERLLERYRDLAKGHFGLACALYDVSAVEAILTEDPGLATTPQGIRRPILHVCFSQYHRMAPSKAEDAVQVARLLLAADADPNDGFPAEPGEEHLLSALYGASGHSCHMGLTQLLLEAGADPNDNESLYHATEQRDLKALTLLLEHGARPEGTNAPFRAMDFDDLRAVEMMLDVGWDPNEGVSHHPSGPAAVGLSVMHHAAQRLCGPQMFELLAARGARLDVTRNGLGAYALALLYGNEEGAEALARLGAPTEVPEALTQLLAGDGPVDPARLPEEARDLASELAGITEALPRLDKFIASGLEWDRPNRMGMTPVQAAGWWGLPENMAFFLKLKPDLSHINGYGGTLLSTIIHGSENAPEVANQDYIACLELALREGVALPRPAIRHAGREDVLAFLEDWAERYPGQVVAHGIA